MAKRYRRLGLAAAALLLAPGAKAAWKVTPEMATRVTWTDNANLQPEGRAENRWIAEFGPGLTVSNDSPRLQFQMNYGLRLYQYAGSKPSNTASHQHALRANAKARLVEEILFLDANASISQQATSAFGPQVNGNSYATGNSNEVRSWRVSPYLLHRFGATAQGELRFAHDAVSTDNVGMRRSDADSVTATLASGPSFRKVGWDAMLSHQKLKDTFAKTGGGQDEQNSAIDVANLALRYAMTSHFNWTANGGYDKYDYDSLGGATKGASYGLCFQWTPSSRTALQASAGHRFYGPSYSLNAQHRSRGTVWNISYSDAVTNSRSQFVLPSAVDTASMLDRLFTPNIADPALRAAAVRAYIQATGLPPTLPNSLNYLSNRFALQKQLNASVAMQLPRSTALLSVFKMRREAVSTTNVDGSLLGSFNENLNDNTDQTGMAATLSYKMGPRTTASLSATATNAKSLSVKSSDHNRAVRLNMARTFSAKLLGSLEVRRVRGGSRELAGQYTENAVTAALTMKF